MSASTLAALPRPRFAVHGTAGSFTTSGLDPAEAVLRAGGKPREPDFAERLGSIPGFSAGQDLRPRPIDIPHGDATHFYSSLANAIIMGAAPPVDAVDARNGLAIIELARCSSEQGLRCLPPPPRL